MYNDTVKPAEILNIKRLIKSKFNSAGFKLIGAQALKVYARPALVFIEKLLHHYLIDNIAGSQRH
jgi:hypothetical protein